MSTYINQNRSFWIVLSKIENDPKTVTETKTP